MDHNRDNPLKRFTAFWIAVLLVGCFGVACIILRPLTHAKVNTAYEEISSERLETKMEIEKAQASAINQEKLAQAGESALKSFKEAPKAGAMPLPAN